MSASLVGRGARGWLRESRWLEWALILFLLGFLVAWDTRLHFNLYYLLLLAPLVVALTRNDWARLFSSRIVLFVTVLMGYMLLSLLWSQDLQPDMAYDRIRRAFQALLFVLVVAWVTLRDSRWLERTVLVATPLAVLTVLLSIGMGHGEGSLWEVRLANVLFYRDNPNSAAVPFAFLALAALFFAFRGRPGWVRWVAAVAVLCGLVFVVLSQSRAAMLAFLVGAAFLFLVWRQWWGLVGLATVTVAGLLAYGMLVDSGALGPIARGDSFRFEIWGIVIERLANNPLLGEGLGVTPEVQRPDGKIYASPHNIWLSATLHGGLLGLAMLLALLAIAVRVAWCNAWKRGDAQSVLYASLLLAGIVLLNFDGHSLIARVNPHYWIGLWLPLGLLAASELAAREPD